MSLIDHHALFELKSGSKLANEIADKHFDEYDNENQKDTTEFLINSVNEELEAQLYENCRKEDTFVS